MRPLSRVRFDALAGYARQPLAYSFAEELAWFEHGSERVLGVVLRDQTDGDFAGMVMARDRRGRFRAVDFTRFEPTRRRAQALLRGVMERLAMAPDVDTSSPLSPRWDTVSTGPMRYRTSRVMVSAAHPPSRQ